MERIMYPTMSITVSNTTKEKGEMNMLIPVIWIGVHTR